MAYNTNQQQRDKAAARNYALKLAFEAPLRRQMKGKFDDISQDFVQHYSKFGVIPDTTDHGQDIQTTLQRHYNNVSNIFSKQITNDLGKPDNHDEVRQDIDFNRQLHQTIKATQSAQLINQTNQNNMHDAVKKTILAAAAAGIFLTNRQVANRAKFEIDKSFAGRLSAIAISETQNPAEHAKQSEINFLSENNAIIGKVNIATAKKDKDWSAILDGDTRPAHAAADGQRQPFNQPYIVMNERLMYPGDTSLGASASNVIGCRCSSIITIR